MGIGMNVIKSDSLKSKHTYIQSVYIFESQQTFFISYFEVEYISENFGNFK